MNVTLLPYRNQRLMSLYLTSLYQKNGNRATDHVKGDVATFKASIIHHLGTMMNPLSRNIYLNMKTNVFIQFFLTRKFLCFSFKYKKKCYFINYHRWSIEGKKKNPYSY